MSNSGMSNYGNLSTLNNVNVNNGNNCVSTQPIIQASVCLKQEFDSLWNEYAILYDYKQQYYSIFAQKGYNCISLLSFLTNDILTNDIGMNHLHCQSFNQLILRWQNNKNIFENWLKQINMYNQYYWIMNKYGIVTFDAFYRKIDHGVSMDYTALKQCLINQENKMNIDKDLAFMLQHTPKYQRLFGSPLCRNIKQI